MEANKTKENSVDIGKYIALSRSLRDMSQADLAEASGVAQSQISRIEKGETKNPGVQDVARIAGALNISFDNLMLGGEKLMQELAYTISYLPALIIGKDENGDPVDLYHSPSKRNDGSDEKTKFYVIGESEEEVSKVLRTEILRQVENGEKVLYLTDKENGVDFFRSAGLAEESFHTNSIGATQISFVSYKSNSINDLKVKTKEISDTVHLGTEYGADFKIISDTIQFDIETYNPVYKALFQADTPELNYIDRMLREAFQTWNEKDLFESFSVNDFCDLIEEIGENEKYKLLLIEHLMSSEELKKLLEGVFAYINGQTLLLPATSDTLRGRILKSYMNFMRAKTFLIHTPVEVRPLLVIDLSSEVTNEIFEIVLAELEKYDFAASIGVPGLTEAVDRDEAGPHGGSKNRKILWLDGKSCSSGLRRRLRITDTVYQFAISESQSKPVYIPSTSGPREDYETITLIDTDILTEREKELLENR